MKNRKGGCYGMFHCLQVIVLFVMALIEMLDIVFIRMDIYSNGFVLCSSISVFVCGSSYFAYSTNR